MLTNTYNEYRLNEMERRLHPQSNDDFETLYTELETWRNEEAQKLNSILPHHSHTTKKGMEQDILKKETTILRKIEKMKLDAMEVRKSKRIDTMLTLMTQPKRWKLRNGDTAEVHTPFTTRAVHLKKLYENLNDDSLDGEL